MGEASGLSRNRSQRHSISLTYTEEELRPWYQRPPLNLNQPLLRTWDFYSASKPNSANCICPTSACQPLDTFEARAASLTTHANPSTWFATPFISFTTSPEVARKYADRRAPTRGLQKLTVINPGARVAHGRHILDMASEMQHYGVRDPFCKFYECYRDEYLCLWEVTADEIVGHWDWTDLIQMTDWYTEIILPAFQIHNMRLLTGPSGQRMQEVLALLDALPGVSSNVEEQSSRRTDRSTENESLEPEYVLDESWDSSSEGYDECFEDQE
ncbi:hypothetical protein BDV28DRAFT_147240 [Aspergillus coremiiformis]|uniref:DUF7587 domain-containing protein n=1 Tax=Aspergillus coremiiformis TaxID=138285 RepID=A0A5N6Z9K7_9EURO|nr:hypothetical protein BDV28DRAFT_147240 [Aspergillus coremiiformis]